MNGKQEQSSSLSSSSSSSCSSSCSSSSHPSSSLLCLSPILDYEYLLQEQPDILKGYLKRSKSGKLFLDFRDPEVQLVITKALLAQDFGLSIKLDSSRLIPPVPNRFLYLQWIKDLLDLEPEGVAIDGGDGGSGSVNVNIQPLLVLDIGTGASCIYPLLGSKYYGWHFVASERYRIELFISSFTLTFTFTFLCIYLSPTHCTRY